MSKLQWGRWRGRRPGGLTLTILLVILIAAALLLTSCRDVVAPKSCEGLIYKSQPPHADQPDTLRLYNCRK